MIGKNWLKRCAFVFVGVCLASVSASAQRNDRAGALDCNDDWSGNRLATHCEIKEQTLAATKGTLSVDARENGGIRIKGWDRSDVLVRARVHSAAPTQSEADSLATQVRVETANSKIHAEGPRRRQDYYWDVSYEIFVPRQSDLSLETYNGGIGISDVRGRIEFTAVNGGIHLQGLGGRVRGSTTNGGLHIELDGDRWDGEELDVETTNGGIQMSVPENYSARLETGTVNGSLHVDFPVTMQGRISKEVNVVLGSGGATVRALTTNGGVKINRRS